MADLNDMTLDSLGINLPYSIEAEQAVLGAVITDASVLPEVMGIITPEQFYSKENGAIFRQMVFLFMAGKPIDYITVLDEVRSAGVFESEEEAKVYLFSITQTVPTIKNVGSYAKIVYEKYLMRSLIGASREIMTQSSDGQQPVEKLLDYAEQRIFEIRSGRESSSLTPIVSVLMETLGHLKDMSGPEKERFMGLESGFKYLDKTLTGLNRSDLIILAARPGVGKTSFALNIAANVAQKYPDKAVAIFSLEMTNRQLVERMLSSDSGVVSQAFRNGEVQDDDWIRIAESSDKLGKTHIYLDDTSGITVGEIKARARRIDNLGLLIVDYLQLMTGSGRNDSRVNEVSEITRSFKIMAKELDIPIILLSQLSRGSEKQARRPMLSDLRDSGSIEQDADIVLFLHRELPEGGEYQDPSEISEMLLMVAKNRHGEVTNLKLHWDGKLTKFTSMEFNRDD